MGAAIVIAGAPACSGDDPESPGPIGEGGNNASGGDPAINGAGEKSDNNAGEKSDNNAGEPGVAGKGGAQGGTSGSGGSAPLGGSAIQGGAPPSEGGEGGAGGTPVEPATSAITGVVRSKTAPLQGLAVVLEGKTTLTDAQGKFTFEDVGTSYQLTIISASNKVALVLDGLSGRAPQITFPLAEEDPPYSTNVGGFARSNVYNVPTWQTQVFFMSDDQLLLVNAATSPATDAFSLFAEWSGASSIHGTLWAVVRSTNAAGRQWPVVASKPLTLKNGVPIKPTPGGGGGGGGEGGGGGQGPSTSPADLTFAATPGQRTFKCGASGPSGWSFQMELLVGPARAPVIVPGTPPFDCTAPVGTGLPVSIRVISEEASSGDYSIAIKPVPESGDVNVVVQAAAKRVLPIANAKGITPATEFSFTAPPQDSVARVSFSLGGWQIHRLTSTQKTTLPDLSAFGVPFPKNAQGSWVVGARGPAASVDEAASLGALLPNSIVFSDAVWSGSDDEFGRDYFTTAP